MTGGDWLLLYVGTCFVAACVGTTTAERKVFKRDNEEIVVTDYVRDDEGVVKSFLFWIVITLVCGPLALLFLWFTFDDARKRGKTRVEYKRKSS